MDDQTSKRSLIDVDVADDDDDADIDVDVESDSDVSTNDGNSSSTKNETSPTQKLSPTLPPISHPTPGKKFNHGGRHSTEVALALHTQPSRVRFLAFPKFFL